MELKKGYKRTDIGVIPEDWIVKELREVLTFGNGIDYKHLEKGDIPVYGTGGVMTYVNNFLYDGEAVGIGRKGTINKPVFLNGKFWTVDTLFYAHNFKNVLSHLIYYNFHLINWLDYNEASGVPSLSKATIEKIRIPLPSNLSEQKAIAQVLIDTDQLIQNLKTLIAKKKAIKQGAMRELLTGKKRLKDFKGDWEYKKLPELIWFQEGPGLRNWQFTDKGIKVINITNLVDGYLDLTRTTRHISLEEFNKMYRHFEIDKGDVVMASSGNSYCKTSIIRDVDLPLVMNTSVIRFKPKDNYDFKFMFIYLKSYLFKDQIDLLITGGAQPNFGPFHLNKVDLPFPKIEEQKAIAHILSDMDSEIEALEIQLQKTQNLKQGMMQELLTGKIRLVNTIGQPNYKENENIFIAAEPIPSYRKE
ncbi:restriction endonuclease subunit S [Bizionia sp.]|uniref:restriction endonuclease subunit S n=1 Tax=Bizionia sp. TaxID=1954480 RepID=UPI003A95D6B0